MAMSEWRAFDGFTIAGEREIGGVYEFSNGLEVVYIGGTNEVRRRLQEHLVSSDACVRKNAKRYRVDYRLDYGVEEGKRILVHVQTYGRRPICNDITPRPRFGP